MCVVLTCACAGVVVARAALDYEAARELSAVLRATDGVTGAYADTALTVTVTDVNDNAPEFSEDAYRVSVSEAASLGDPVLAVSARDLDEGERRLDRRRNTS